MFWTFPFLNMLRWQDAVDMFLVGYILFRLYVLFRGTMIFRILLGLAILWLVQRLASYEGLIVTTWMLQGVTAVAALVVIVVFRHELRAVFQAKTLRAVLWGIPRLGRLTPIDLVADTAFELAQRRHGALIVIPGKDVLGEEVLHSGIVWDGRLSKEMLLSVFWPDNPVHDGAAVAQGDRVAEVGAILPLSHSQDLPSYYGTRHRAALGLAEMTDALVVVVSEERGTVTTASAGRFRIFSTRASLTQALAEHSGVDVEGRGPVRRERLGLGLAALASLLFVIAAWLSFTQGMDTITSIEVPIEYTNRDPNIEILKTSSQTVHLRLSGSAALIKLMRPEQVQARVDLKEAGVGLKVFTVSADQVTLPPGILLQQVDPPEIRVTLDVPVTRTLPLQVDWTGRLADNLVLTQVTLSPTQLQVIGGSQLVGSLSTLYTEPVPLEQIKESGVVEVKPSLSSATLKLAPGARDRVKIRYVVHPREPAGSKG
jgi:uncharacterized protein (TIGR00159 family)